jgi:RNA polymerase sigma-70 factor (ECF subfamily)
MTDQPDFAECYGAQFRPIARQLAVYLGSVEEAQEVTQEAFTRAWVRWGRIARYDDPGAWVRRVAWNLATSRIRARPAGHGMARHGRTAGRPGCGAAVRAGRRVGVPAGGQDG